jgi:hypothetical protein
MPLLIGRPRTAGSEGQRTGFKGNGERVKAAEFSEPRCVGVIGAPATESQYRARLRRLTAAGRSAPVPMFRVAGQARTMKELQGPLRIDPAEYQAQLGTAFAPVPPVRREQAALPVFPGLKRPRSGPHGLRGFGGVPRSRAGAARGRSALSNRAALLRIRACSVTLSRSSRAARVLGRLDLSGVAVALTGGFALAEKAHSVFAPGASV